MASGIVLRFVPPGSFMMASPESEPHRRLDEGQHARWIREGFYMGETEVTVAQWRLFVDATGYVTDAERGTSRSIGGYGIRTLASDQLRWAVVRGSWRNPLVNVRCFVSQDSHPVVCVSWNDAKAFCDYMGLQMPTEAQWEYACRAGSATRFAWGDDPAAAARNANCADATVREIWRRACYQPGDGWVWLAPVASLLPNRWGLHDMVGNVEEWCRDGYQGDFAGLRDEAAAPQWVGRSSWAMLAVVRGGSWALDIWQGRSAARSWCFGDVCDARIGFRVMLPADGRLRVEQAP